MHIYMTYYSSHKPHSQIIIVNHIVVSLMLTMLTNLYCDCSECDIQLEKH